MAINMLFADEDGQIFDHPDYAAVGQSAGATLPLSDGDVVEVPEGTKVFYLPGSQAVGRDKRTGEIKVFKKFRAVTAMLQAGYTRTLTPVARYRKAPKYGCHDYLPLWAYTAVGLRGDKIVGASFRSDPMTHSETQNYDDREIAPRVAKFANTKNRLISHLSRCALEYHCFAAKNYFMERWEAPLPTAPACNARCLGCISLQPADCCPASQERITFVPTVEELCEIAVPHLTKVKRGIVSFGQGCEGEPLMVGDRIAEAVAEFRRQTPLGTVHLNTNGSLPSMLGKIADAGLDSVRISLNSGVKATFDAYYRPVGYQFEDMLQSVKTAKDKGLYASLNLLVFPGISDLPEEVEAVEKLVEETGLDMVHFRNLSIDPALYLRNLPAPLTNRDDAIGIKNFALRLKRKFPKLDIGYFNRPKEDFANPLTTLEFLEG